MTKLRIQCFGISVDGFAAGPDQDINNPMGIGEHAATPNATHVLITKRAS